MRFALATSIAALAVLTAAAPQPTQQDRNISAAIPITKRSTLTNADGSVNADALKAHVISLEAKVLRGFANHEANTGKPHPSAMKGVKKRGNGIPLTGYGITNWYTTVAIGTPSVGFTVVLDTGSSDLFVPGISCDSTCDNRRRRFDPKISSTSRDLLKQFIVMYGDKSHASGELFSDNVAVAGFTATGQTFGAATTYSTEFQDEPSDGLIGMAYQSLSSYPARPFFQTLIAQGQVVPEFSVKLASSGSELFIGGSNPNLFTGSFTFTPVTHQGYWQVNMDNVQGNGRVILNNIDSVIDTGTTLVIGDPTNVSNLYNALGGTPSSIGNGYYTFPCNSFPTISFTFGGAPWDIPASALNIGRDPSDPSQCLSGLIGLDAAMSFWIIGDVFLRGVYTKFDMGNNQVGFAHLA